MKVRLAIFIFMLFSINSTTYALAAAFNSPLQGQVAEKIQKKQSPEWTHMSFEPNLKGVGLWYRTDSAETKSSISPLKKQLRSLLQKPFFQKYLTDPWSIIFDEKWTRSAGFFSDSFLSPDTGEKMRAILLRPQAFLEPDSSESMLVHEILHLIHHDQRPNEQSWVKEGLALLGEYLQLERFDRSFKLGFQNPETSLTRNLDPRAEGYGRSEETLPQYGHILQYFYYLNRVCGDNDFFGDLLTSKSLKTGTEFITDILSTRSYQTEDQTNACANFEKSFRAFQLARFIQDGTKVSGYVTLGYSKAVVRDEPREIPPYSATAYRLTKSEDISAQGDNSRCERESDIPWGPHLCIRIRLH